MNVFEFNCGTIQDSRKDFSYSKKAFEGYAINLHNITRAVDGIISSSAYSDLSSSMALTRRLSEIVNSIYEISNNFKSFETALTGVCDLYIEAENIVKALFIGMGVNLYKERMESVAPDTQGTSSSSTGYDKGDASGRGEYKEPEKYERDNRNYTDGGISGTGVHSPAGYEKEDRPDRDYIYGDRLYADTPGGDAEKYGYPRSLGYTTVGSVKPEDDPFNKIRDWVSGLIEKRGYTTHDNLSSDVNGGYYDYNNFAGWIGRVFPEGIPWPIYAAAVLQGTGHGYGSSPINEILKKYNDMILDWWNNFISGKRKQGGQTVGLNDPMFGASNIPGIPSGYTNNQTGVSNVSAANPGTGTYNGYGPYGPTYKGPGNISPFAPSIGAGIAAIIPGVIKFGNPSGGNTPDLREPFNSLEPKDILGGYDTSPKGLDVASFVPAITGIGVSGILTGKSVDDWYGEKQPFGGGRPGEGGLSDKKQDSSTSSTSSTSYDGQYSGGRPGDGQYDKEKPDTEQPPDAELSGEKQSIDRNSGEGGLVDEKYDNSTSSTSYDGHSGKENSDAGQPGAELSGAELPGEKQSIDRNSDEGLLIDKKYDAPRSSGNNNFNVNGNKNASPSNVSSGGSNSSISPEQYSKTNYYPDDNYITDGPGYTTPIRYVENPREIDDVAYRMTLPAEPDNRYSDYNNNYNSNNPNASSTSNVSSTSNASSTPDSNANTPDSGMTPVSVQASIANPPSAGNVKNNKNSIPSSVGASLVAASVATVAEGGIFGFAAANLLNGSSGDGGDQYDPSAKVLVKAVCKPAVFAGTLEGTYTILGVAVSLLFCGMAFVSGIKLKEKIKKPGFRTGDGVSSVISGGIVQDKQ